MMVEVPTQRRVLSGWGRATASGGEVFRPLATDDLAELWGATRRGVVARGLGRAYGDAATNAGGHVVEMRALRAIRGFDPDSGVVVADAGASIGDLIAAFLPRGWVPPVVPGTRHVTLGGAVAADIHGKDHARAGSFARHVRHLRLATPRGPVEVTREGDAAAFDATTGGMGLTGVITEVSLGLRPIGTSHVRLTHRCHDDLDGVLADVTSSAGRHRHVVAWLDLSGGRNAGRGVVSVGDDAAPGELPVGVRHAPLQRTPSRVVEVPVTAPVPLVNAATVRAFNAAWFRVAGRRPADEVVALERFAFPLDGLGSWSRLYGTRGLVQYQFVVPDAEVAALQRVIGLLRRRGVTVALAVLKQLGAGGPGPLSFPMEGWTLAVDLPAGTRGLAGALDAADVVVAAAGGRVYLAKDARMRREVLREMYPGLDAWREVRDRLDPDRLLTSDLDRRLDLVGRER